MIKTNIAAYFSRFLVKIHRFVMVITKIYADPKPQNRSSRVVGEFWGRLITGVLVEQRNIEFSIFWLKRPCKSHVFLVLLSSLKRAKQ